MYIADRCAVTDSRRKKKKKNLYRDRSNGFRPPAFRKTVLVSAPRTFPLSLFPSAASAPRRSWPTSIFNRIYALSIPRVPYIIDAAIAGLTVRLLCGNQREAGARARWKRSNRARTMNFEMSHHQGGRERAEGGGVFMHRKAFGETCRWLVSRGAPSID